MCKKLFFFFRSKEFNNEMKHLFYFEAYFHLTSSNHEPTSTQVLHTRTKLKCAAACHQDPTCQQFRYFEYLESEHNICYLALQTTIDEAYYGDYEIFVKK